MNKKDLIRAVGERLEQNNIRKPITLPKHTFEISDDEGNTKKFYVKKKDKTVMYSQRDVEVVVDACLEVITDAVQNNEEISIHGFGVLDTYKRAGRMVVAPTGEKIMTDAHYVPRFTAGKQLRIAAKLYEIGAGGD